MGACKNRQASHDVDKDKNLEVVSVALKSGVALCFDPKLLTGMK